MWILVRPAIQPRKTFPEENLRLKIMASGVDLTFAIHLAANFTDCKIADQAELRMPFGRFSMPALTEWTVPPANQPRGADYAFDLDHALASIVGVHSIIPPDAFTADTLGTERAGNGVIIDDGLILTIGYLITEAEAVWLHMGDGRVVQGHALGFDAVTG